MNAVKQVTANWTTQYNLTVTSAHDSPQGAGWYNSGATANFSVTSPADESNGTRYVFTQWSGDYTGSSPSGSLMMTSAKSVTANWQTQYFLATAENPPYGGNISPAPPGDWYNSGSYATVTATPTGNYGWLGWTGHLTGKTNPAQILMSSPKSVTANFAGETISNPNAPSGPASGITGQLLTYTANGAASSFGHAIEQKFSWGDGSESEWGAATMSHSYGTKGNYTIKARARCKQHTEVISDWSEGHAVVIDSYTLTTSVNPPGSGAIYKNPEKSGYDYNEVVKIRTRTKLETIRFAHWGGDLSGTEDPINLIMNGPKNIIACFEFETVSIPNEPVCANEAYVGRPGVTIEIAGSQSSFGHEVEYQIDFGDGNQSDWGASPFDYQYSAKGVYLVSGRARCVEHNEIISEWSATAQITVRGLFLTVKVDPELVGTVIVSPEKSEYDYLELVQLHALANDSSAMFLHWEGVGGGSTTNPIGIHMQTSREINAIFAVETVSMADTPKGPTQGKANETLTFQTGGSVSSFGHAVEYQFDWGDGNWSDWGSSSRSYSYALFGTKLVKARARCQDHHQIISEWSGELPVIISDFDLTITIDPQGTGQVTKNPDKAKYANGESVTLIAEAQPFYQFDHWSGDLAGNLSPAVIVMNSSKQVTAHFIQTAEVVTKPSIVEGPSSGIMGKNLSFSTGGSTSNLGNEVEYQFDWGDDSFSNWDGTTHQHIYFAAGEMQVKSRARSKVNISVISEWSEAKIVVINGHKITITVMPGEAGKVLANPALENFADSSFVQLTAQPDSGYRFIQWSGDVDGSENPTSLLMISDKNVTANFEVIVETVSAPDTIVGLKVGFIGQHLKFSTSGSLNNLGNEIEYQFDFGDSTYSLWNSGEQSHAYFESETFFVKAKARSKANVDIMSEWSNAHTIQIKGLKLIVNISPAEIGLIAQNPYKEEYAYQDTVEMWPVGIAQYAFDHWEGDLLGNAVPGKVIMDSDKNVTAFFTAILETITTPKPPQGPAEGYRGQELRYKASAAVSNLGHPIEYQFDWGDGNISVWGDSIQTHKFQSSGVYLVRDRGRSKVNPEALSFWSDTLSSKIEGCLLTISVDPENAGEIIKMPDLVDYDFGSVVALTANSYPDFRFVHWNDNLQDTSKTKRSL